MRRDLPSSLLPYNTYCMMHVLDESSQLFHKCFFLAKIYENLQNPNMPLNVFGSREIITALTQGMGKLADFRHSVET